MAAPGWSQGFRYDIDGGVLWLWQDDMKAAPTGLHHAGFMLAGDQLHFALSLAPEIWTVLRRSAEQGLDAATQFRSVATAVPLTEITAVGLVPDLSTVLVRVGSGSLFTDIELMIPGSHLPGDIFHELHFELAPHAEPRSVKPTFWHAAIIPLSYAIPTIILAAIMIWNALSPPANPQYRNRMFRLFDAISSFFGAGGIALIASLVLLGLFLWARLRIAHMPEMKEIIIKSSGEGISLHA